MLAYILALAVGLGSFALYMAAFFFPEIHRKNDFIWSGVGLFYALVIWLFARRITGGLLLGHVASVALLGWFGWQTLLLRRQLTPKILQTEVPSAEAMKATVKEQATKLSLPQRLGQLPGSIGGLFAGAKAKVQKPKPQKAPSAAKTTPPATTPPVVTDNPPVVIENAVAATENAVAAKPTVEIIDNRTPIPKVEAIANEDGSEKTESQAEPVAPNPPSPELTEAAQVDGAAEEKILVVEDVAPDAVLAPPAEDPLLPDTPGAN